MLGDDFEVVLAAAQAGAGWAFERLYQELAPAVAGYGRLRGAGDPEGLANDVMVAVFHRVGPFAGDERAFRAFVFTVAHRRLIDELRRAASRPRTRSFDGVDVVGGDVEADALDRLGTARVTERLGRLSPDQRDVLLLRIVGDLSVEQVAAVLGKRPNAVKQLQRRGLDALRREISRGGVTL